MFKSISLCSQELHVQKKSSFTGKSVTDKSKFRPALVDNSTGQRIEVGGVYTGLYDFPDGKDTGLRYGAIRQINPDVTEVDATMEYLQGEVENIKRNVQMDIEKAREDVIESFKKDSNNKSNIHGGENG